MLFYIQKTKFLYRKAKFYLYLINFIFYLIVNNIFLKYKS